MYEHYNEYVKQKVAILLEHAEKVGVIEMLKNYGEQVSVQIPLGKMLCETEIDDLELSVRARNCLHRAGVKTVFDLTELIMTEGKMERLRNLGRKSIVEIKTVLLVMAYERLTTERKAEFWENVLQENGVLRAS